MNLAISALPLASRPPREVGASQLAKPNREDVSSSAQANPLPISSFQFSNSEPDQDSRPEAASRPPRVLLESGEVRFSHFARVRVTNGANVPGTVNRVETSSLYT